MPKQFKKKKHRITIRIENYKNNLSHIAKQLLQRVYNGFRRHEIFSEVIKENMNLITIFKIEI